MALAILDTDTVTEIRRGTNPYVIRRGTSYLNLHGQFGFSIITRYEVLRGLKAKQALKQVMLFDAFCQHCDVFSLEDDIVVRAADLYADLRRRGQLIGDADLFIAATALHHGRTLATANLGHFQRIPGLHLEDWTAP